MNRYYVEIEHPRPRNMVFFIYMMAIMPKQIIDMLMKKYVVAVTQQMDRKNI